MSSSLLIKVKSVLIKILIIITVVFLQFVYLNIMPERVNEADFFLIISALYILKSDYKTSFLFLFGAVFVDEIVFPIGKIIGVKVLSALILGYILFLVFRKMVLKGWILCLTVGIYSVAVFVMTKLILVFLKYSDLSFNITDYLWLFFNTFLITCLVGKKLNVR